jgi:hypothetical protein
VTGWCLDVHALAVAKLVAGREKDLDFVCVLVRERMVDPALLEERVTMLRDSEGVRDLARSRLSEVLRSICQARLASPSMSRSRAAFNPG